MRTLASFFSWERRHPDGKVVNARCLKAMYSRTVIHTPADVFAVKMTAFPDQDDGVSGFLVNPEIVLKRHILRNISSVFLRRNKFYSPRRLKCFFR